MGLAPLHTLFRVPNTPIYTRCIECQTSYIHYRSCQIPLHTLRIVEIFKRPVAPSRGRAPPLRRRRFAPHASAPPGTSCGRRGVGGECGRACARDEPLGRSRAAPASQRGPTPGHGERSRLQLLPKLAGTDTAVLDYWLGKIGWAKLAGPVS